MRQSGWSPTLLHPYGNGSRQAVRLGRTFALQAAAYVTIVWGTVPALYADRVAEAGVRPTSRFATQIASR